MKAVNVSLVVILVASVLAACGTTNNKGARSGKPNTQPPAITLQIVSPAKQNSYWRDAVQYPYAVHEAKAKDALDREWKLAYIDEYAGPGDREDAPVVVLLHCRCGNLGYFNTLIQQLVQDYRVVAFDLPNYGKSIPGNLDLPVTRSLDTSRDLVYQVLKNELNISHASLVGHSLGGQWALGFALKYPMFVDALILESSYGLEEYQVKPFRFDNRQVDLFNAGYPPEISLPEETWRLNPLYVKEYSLTQGELRDRLLFTDEQRDDLLPRWNRRAKSEAGEPPSVTSLFRMSESDARFFVASRAQAAEGNQREFDQLVRACVWDLYASAAELRADDERSLPARLGQVRARTFLAFGKHDSYLPNDFMTGESLTVDKLAGAAMTRIRVGGAEVTAKIYDAAAHTPHLDVPVQFGTDVLNFLKRETVVDAFR